MSAPLRKHTTLKYSTACLFASVTWSAVATDLSVLVPSGILCNSILCILVSARPYIPINSKLLRPSLKFSMYDSLNLLYPYLALKKFLKIGNTDSKSLWLRCSSSYDIILICSSNHRQYNFISWYPKYSNPFNSVCQASVHLPITSDWIFPLILFKIYFLSRHLLYAIFFSWSPMQLLSRLPDW